MKISNVKKMLKAFSTYSKILLSLNKNIVKINKKKIRKPNFPSEISENIAKYALIKKYGWDISWNTESGDLSRKTEQKNYKIEVKGFSSNGPISFGPKENWDYICFVDCRNFLNKEFVVYFSDISNLNNKWKNIKFTKKSTFYSQTKKGIRPRTEFKEIIKKLPLTIIFSGNIDEL